MRTSAPSRATKRQSAGRSTPKLLESDILHSLHSCLSVSCRGFLLIAGDSVSLRLPFAFWRVNERYGDLSTIVQWPAMHLDSRTSCIGYLVSPTGVHCAVAIFHLPEFLTNTT